VTSHMSILLVNWLIWLVHICALLYVALTLLVGRQEVHPGETLQEVEASKRCI